MHWWEAALLGLIQGLTEFLPVSSSGHLVLGQSILGLRPGGDATFEVFVHLGTALSIGVVYRDRLWTMLRASTAAVTRPGQVRARIMEDSELRTVGYILIALVPTAVLYILFSDALEAAFSDPRITSAFLLVTGALLLLTRLSRGGVGPLSVVKAVLIGIAQAAAMLPGISRSGTTICTGLYLGVDAERAADFSFLILLPAVLGAAVLKAGQLVADPATWLPVAVGTLVAFLSGMLAIRLVLAVVRRGHLHYFAYYCFAAGTFGLLLTGN